METLHFKTVDPVSQELLRSAAGRGICLNWDRYEKQQPQDGFSRLGLACPYGCLQGPCRIDPFGRGSQRGICGLDRDAMVAASLLRLCLQGVLETAAAQSLAGDATVQFSEPLARKAAATLKLTGADSLSQAEIAQSALLLSRPSAATETLVRQAIRLSLLDIALREGRKSASSGEVSVGYGLLAGEAIVIGVAGRLSAGLIAEVRQQAAALKGPEVRLLTLGDWIFCEDAFLPVVCTSAEAETVLSSGRVNLLLAGEGVDPGLSALCTRMNLPVVCADGNVSAACILQKARDAFNRRTPVAFIPDASLIGKNRVSAGAQEIERALKGQSRIALLGGADTLFSSLGNLPVELAKALRGQDHEVASWGDSALWMIKQDLPVTVLDALDGPLDAVRALAQAANLTALKGIFFSGLKANRDFTLALGLASLGLKVSLSTPLPLWGSEKVRTLLRQNLAAAGGILTHADHPSTGDEVLDWFLRS
jgi:hypothetical protein